MSTAARLRAALARERERGVDFDTAWALAIAEVGREDWATALAWSKEEWRTAYERRAGRFEALSPIEREHVPSGRTPTAA